VHNLAYLAGRGCQQDAAAALKHPIDANAACGVCALRRLAPPDDIIFL
jgi:hypothetical protein